MFNERARADAHRRKLLVLWDPEGTRPLPQGLEEFIGGVASALAMRDRMIHDLLQEGAVDSQRDSGAPSPSPSRARRVEDVFCMVCGTPRDYPRDQFSEDVRKPDHLCQVCGAEYSTLYHPPPPSSPPPPSAEALCQVCGHAYGVHAEAYKLDPLTHRLSNCARNAGLPQSECPVCIGGVLVCPEPHMFQEPSYK